MRVLCAWRMDECGMKEKGRCSHPKRNNKYNCTLTAWSFVAFFMVIGF
jgi:hypothetical protein